MSEELELQGTTCGKCIFAVWEGEQQIECKANRLKQFKEIGETISLVKNDDEKISYFIHNRICTMCCKASWLKDNPKIKNPLQEVRSRIALKCDALVLVYNESIEDINTTVQSLLTQEYKPATIHVVLNSNKVQPWEVARLLRKLEKKNKYLWQISNIDERVPDTDKERVSLEWCVDHVIHKCKTPFYSVFVAGFKAPSTFYKKIDEALNDKLYKFAALIPIDDWNGTFVQTALHKKLNGNFPTQLEEDLIAFTIIDKAHYIANKEGHIGIVLKAVEICPELQS